MAETTPENLDRRAREFYNKAFAALDRNNLDYAIVMFLQTLAIAPNFTLGRKYLRAAQMKRAETLGTMKRMLASVKVAPTVTKAKLAIAKNPLEAIQIIEHALNDDPKNGQALMTLAEAAEAAQLYETAAQTLDTYTRFNPRDIKALHWLGRMYSAMGNHELARELYERLLQTNPNDFDAQKGLKDSTAHGAMQGGGWEDQSTSFREKLKDEKESVELEQKSRMVRAGDHVDNLISELKERSMVDPDNPIHQRELGKLYAQKNDFDTALQYLEKLFAAESGSDPGLEKEINEIQAKKIQSKISARKAALDAAPGNAAIEKEIADLDIQLSQLQLRDAESLVERYPNDLMYRFDLAVLHMKTGNIAGAIEQFQKAVGQPQRRVASLNYLGQCFEHEGLHDLAIDQYSKAQEELPMMDGLKKDVTYNLGNCYELMGDIDKAIAEFKKIAAVDFGYKDIRQRIMRKPPQK
ncbi:MAG: tetratricopeptide repeat protein [Verrucomicrobiota bacterium]